MSIAPPRPPAHPARALRAAVDTSAVLPVDLDLSGLSNLAAILGLPQVNLPPDASKQEKKDAIASAVVAEAAHKQHEQAPMGTQNYQEDAEAAARTFLSDMGLRSALPPSSVAGSGISADS